MAKAHPNIDLRLKTEFVSFEQDADGVVARVVNAGGEEEAIEGRYLVSGEGARSLVRKELGIAFEGFTYDDRTLNIEVAYDFRSTVTPTATTFPTRSEWSNLFHWKGPPDRWRVHFPTDPKADETALMQPEALQTHLQRFLPIGKPFDIVGSNLYVVHQRVADKFRVGRAILAGDFAHVNSPIGAMGMNSGIHDADQSRRQAHRHCRATKPTTAYSTATSGNAATSPSRTRKRKPFATKAAPAEQDPPVRQRNHDELRRTAEDPELARKFLLRTALFESLKEAEAIT